MATSRTGPWTLVQGPFGVSAEVAEFVQSACSELPQPRSLAERNWAQLALTERVRGQFDIDRLDALVVVATVYGNRYPH